MIYLEDSEFYKNGTWEVPIEGIVYIPGPHYVELFDQNGYSLTLLETIYADVNNQPPTSHRKELAIKKDWFTQEYADTGAVINHAFILERKGYTGDAKAQLEEWAKSNNMLYKLVKYKGKWGVDFSIDYVDANANVFEIFHYEYDSLDLDEINEIKSKVEDLVLNTDWNHAASVLLKKKQEWWNLNVFEQSNYKSNFFGIKSDSAYVKPNEAVKLTTWD